MSALKDLSPDDINQFHANGYIIVSGVYTADEIATARKIFDEAFNNEVWKKAPFSSEQIINDIYRVYPELVDIVFNRNYINVLKGLFGNSIVCIPECSIHHNRFFDWHKDSSLMESEGSTEHWAGADFMVQCCTYFQDNEDEGGGMTVIPGTHLTKDRFLKVYSQRFHHRIYYKLLKLMHASPFYQVEKNEQVIRLPSKAGDLVIIDIRLDHRATFLRKINGLPKPTDKRKYAIFNAFGRPGNLPREYLATLKTARGNYNQYLNQTTCAPALSEAATKMDFEIYE